MTGTKAGSREADTKKILLGKGWLFHLGDCPDAWKKDYAPEWQRSIKKYYENTNLCQVNGK